MALVGTFASGSRTRSKAAQLDRAAALDPRASRGAARGQLSGELRELLGIIRQEVKRLDNLVGDFLQFSRSNRLAYRPASVDDLLDEVVRLLRPEALAAGVTLRRQSIGVPIRTCAWTPKGSSKW